MSPGERRSNGEDPAQLRELRGAAAVARIREGYSRTKRALASVTIWVSTETADYKLLTPSPLYPVLQVHVNEPSVLLHDALVSQSCVPAAHSSMSVSQW